MPTLAMAGGRVTEWVGGSYYCSTSKHLFLHSRSRVRVTYEEASGQEHLVHNGGS
jgi:hypothetical protein